MKVLGSVLSTTKKYPLGTEEPLFARCPQRHQRQTAEPAPSPGQHPHSQAQVFSLWSGWLGSRAEKHPGWGTGLRTASVCQDGLAEPLALSCTAEDPRVDGSRPARCQSSSFMGTGWVSVTRGRYGALGGDILHCGTAGPRAQPRHEQTLRQNPGRQQSSGLRVIEEASP